MHTINSLLFIILTLGLTLGSGLAFADNHITTKRCELKIFGLRLEDRVTCDGSNGQFCGHKKTVTFTIGVYQDRLDAPIKRIGFMGTDGQTPKQIEVLPKDEYSNSLWDLKFDLDHRIAWSHLKHSYKGAFFVETTKSTYFWLKLDNDRDYEFGPDMASDLSLYDNGCN